MSKIERFEALAERLVEGTFARLFAGHLRPLEVVTHLVRAMEDYQVIAPDATPHAPTHYWVYLHPDDCSAVAGQQPALETELARYVAELAGQAGLALDATPVVHVVTDEHLMPREVRVDARWIPREGTGVERTREMERGDALRQAQGETLRQAQGETLRQAQGETLRQAQGDATGQAQDDALGQAQGDATGQAEGGSTGQAQGDAVADGILPHGRPFLVLEGRRHVNLLQPVISIGRALDNDMIIEDSRVSRHHAQLRLRYGRYVLYDLGSSGGTQINGYPVEECVLHSGDVVSFAGVQVIYGEDPPTPISLADSGDTPAFAPGDIEPE